MFVIFFLAGYALKCLIQHMSCLHVETESTHVVLIKFNSVLSPDYEKFIPFFVVEVASDSAVSLRKRIVQMLTVAVEDANKHTIWKREQRSQQEQKFESVSSSVPRETYGPSSSPKSDSGGEGPIASAAAAALESSTSAAVRFKTSAGGAGLRFPVGEPAFVGVAANPTAFCFPLSPVRSNIDLIFRAFRLPLGPVKSSLSNASFIPVDAVGARPTFASDVELSKYSGVCEDGLPSPLLGRSFESSEPPDKGTTGALRCLENCDRGPGDEERLLPTPGEEG